MIRSAALGAVLALLAAGAPVWAGSPEAVWVDDLDARDRLLVRTADYQLRLEMVDPSTGEADAALSRDGVHFGPADRVFVLGATAGRHPEGAMFVRMGRIEVGKRLELAVHSMDATHRRLTAPVEHLYVRRPAPIP